MGSRLSEERQRVGIARVMLADPDVVVMDEPTSSLDILHEKELLKTLEEEYSHKPADHIPSDVHPDRMQQDHTPGTWERDREPGNENMFD